MKEDAGKPVTGLHTDFTPKDQPKQTYRFALNAVDETAQGDSSSISNEESNVECAEFPAGYRPIGKVYITDDKTAVFLVNDITGDSEIGIVDSYCKYTTHVSDAGQSDKLEFSIDKQIDAVYRLRRGCEDVIYFVDGKNDDRHYNFSKPDDFKTGGFWDISKFALDTKIESIPNINSIDVTQDGNLPPGSYNVGIALVDSNKNVTTVLNVSDTIILYHDDYEQLFSEITGSTTEEAQYFNYSDGTGKGLKITLSELDESYDFYRVFLIAANGASGRISSITYSDDVPIDQTEFYITGTNVQYPTTEAELIVGRVKISASDHIEQIDNRLIRANTIGDQADYCGMQTLASKIKTDLALKEITLNDINKFGCPKRATYHEEQSQGYMPGELYAMGIVYTFEDGYESPAFHIPGASQTETTQMSKNNTVTQFYQEDDCPEPYWGDDHEGNGLAGQAVRHHRFPSRSELGIPLYTENVILNEPTGTYIHTVVVKINEEYNDNYNYDTLYLRIKYDNAETGETNIEFIKAFPNIYVNDGEPLVLEAALPEITTDSAANPYTINQVKFVNPSGNDGIFFIDPVNTVGPISYSAFISSTPVLNKEVEFKSQIMGFEFTNIMLPPGAIGYHIVRMHRGEDNKTVLDSGIMAPLMKDDKYEAFAAWNPANDITRGTERWAFFNPEYKFRGTEYGNVDRVVREGRYAVTDKTIFTNIVEDVQAGTSYDSKISKRRERDEDGFDLKTMVRYNELAYTIDGTQLTSNVTDIKYLSALSSVTMQGEKVFNASGDNKIGIMEYTSAQGTFDSIPYVTLHRDLSDPYPNFRTGKYYKEHTTLSEVTASAFSVFNGDTYISPATLTNTIFYDIRLRNRSAKSGIWRIIGGVLVIAFGIVASILSLGIGVPATAFIIGAGVSSVASGINQAIIKKTYQEEYEKGLGETIKDSEIYNEFGGNPPDDQIQYFSDILENVWFESTVNMHWRLEPNYGPQMYLKSPEYLNKNRINDYILDKLTVIDTESESGRLYQGFPLAEVYFINRDYERRNRQKYFYPLAPEYDCCSECREEFPQRVHWSEQSFQEELQDHYRITLPNNYRDIEGDLGPISDLFTIQNNLYLHTKEGLWHLPQNIQERVTGDIVSFIGTGEYFAIPPRKIIDDETGLSGGNEHKWATLKTPYGVFFVCEAQGTIYQFNGSNLQPITSHGNFTWFKENVPLRLNNEWRRREGRNYPYLANPANKYGIGFHATYDSRKERIIITKRDFVFDRNIEVIQTGPNTFQQPLVFGDYEITFWNGSFYVFSNYDQNIADNEAEGWVYQGIIKDQMYFERYNEQTKKLETLFINGGKATESYIYNASWTMSYSLKNQTWRSFHSYLPNFYIHTPERYFSYIWDSNFLWQHNKVGNYQNFYGQRYAFILDYISNSMPVETRIYNHIRLLTDARRFDSDLEEYVDVRHVTFNKLITYNSRQCSGLLNMLVKDIQDSPESYIQQQIEDPTGNVIIIDRQERDWTINDLRDFRTDYEVPMFIKDVEQLQDEYFIDKILNDASIDFNKDWTELESFRDKYLGIRLIFDTFDDIKLIVDYSVVNEQKSHR